MNFAYHMNVTRTADDRPDLGEFGIHLGSPILRLNTRDHLSVYKTQDQSREQHSAALLIEDIAHYAVLCDLGHACRPMASYHDFVQADHARGVQGPDLANTPERALPPFHG